MGSLHLDTLSPDLRNKILAFKIDKDYETGNQIEYSYSTPIDNVVPKLTE
jgi:hypothetical protein